MKIRPITLIGLGLALSAIVCVFVAPLWVAIGVQLVAIVVNGYAVATSK